MKKIVSLIITLALALSCYTSSQISAAQIEAAAQDQDPFSIYIQQGSANETENIVFSTQEKINLYISESNSETKQVIYDDIVEKEVVVSNIRLNINYSVTIKTFKGQLYTGIIKLYDKPDSKFTGLLSEISLITANNSGVNERDDERTVKTVILSEMEKTIVSRLPINFLAHL